VVSAVLPCAGYGGLIDYFVGQPSGSSIIQLHDAQRLRIACTTAVAELEVVLLTPRSKVLPGSDKPQVSRMGDVTWNVSGLRNGTTASWQRLGSLARAERDQCTCPAAPVPHLPQALNQYRLVATSLTHNCESAMHS
jgi:hypothetical protein